MNYLQQKQKAKGLIVLVDIKHSHLYNWKLYFFLTFPFFGSKIQHFSTFGSNQDDHDIVIVVICHPVNKTFSCILFWFVSTEIKGPIRSCHFVRKQN